jgi:hypothetical protein
VANIATVFVTLLPKPGASAIHHLEVFHALLGKHGSYNVPLFYGERDGRIDVQYGVRWSPNGGPNDLFDAVGDRIARMFVRWHDLGVEDRIYEVVDGQNDSERTCRYGFDAVAFRFRAGAEVPSAPPSNAEGWAVLAGLGSYGGENSRTPASLGPGTPTTLAGTSSPVSRIEPSDLSERIAALAKESIGREWFWKGRVTRMERRFSDGHWSHFGIDDWDNCVDPAFVQARDSI